MTRESPTKLLMGIQEHMLVRIQQPLRNRFDRLYDRYCGLLDLNGIEAPRIGIGAFITYLATVGADELERQLGPLLDQRAKAAKRKKGR